MGRQTLVSRTLGLRRERPPRGGLAGDSLSVSAFGSVPISVSTRVSNLYLRYCECEQMLGMVSVQLCSLWWEITSKTKSVTHATDLSQTSPSRVSHLTNSFGFYATYRGARGGEMLQDTPRKTIRQALEREPPWAKNRASERPAANICATLSTCAPCSPSGTIRTANHSISICSRRVPVD